MKICKRVVFVSWLLATLLAFAGCATSKPAPVQSNAIPVIFDTDIGDDIDDTWALGFLLRCPELDLKLAVGDNGKAGYRAKLLAKFLQTTGHTNVAVGVGLNVPAADNEERQHAWIKDYDLTKYPGQVRPDGVQAIIDTIMNSPRPVTVIAVGPVQNIAAALRREPRIAERARFVGMHGSVRVGYNNDPRISAEYNVKLAPYACQAAFAAPWEVTITPLDTCDKISLSGDGYQRVFQSADPIAKAVIENYRLWSLAGGADLVSGFPLRSTTLFDTVAVYLAFSHDWCVLETLGIRVDDAGFTQEEATARKVNVATQWTNLPAFEALLVARLTLGH